MVDPNKMKDILRLATEQEYSCNNSGNKGSTSTDGKGKHAQGGGSISHVLSLFHHGKLSDIKKSFQRVNHGGTSAAALAGG